MADTVATNLTSMRFFIPHTSPVQEEEVYAGIKKALLSQFRLPIVDRRIQSLSYFNSKRHWHAQVGQMEQQERRYDVWAIFESKQYIVFTRTPLGAAGPIILVDKTEVTAVQDFE
ncbi:hypothetical protein IPG36_00280 [bacterium]|nr:MAG: hypothetical protein IPG36_00280 [bacterium]